MTRQEPSAGEWRNTIVEQGELTSQVESAFGKLYNIMRVLRQECPWDREQTHESLRQYLLEETFEVLETLDEQDFGSLRKELGDLLLQILFHSEIASQNARFNLVDVIEAISRKLIERHPHVFGETEVANAEEVLRNWETIKLAEEDRQSVLEGVPKALPALVRAHRIQEKASNVGFDWMDINDVWPKVEEELSELKEACDQSNAHKIEEELGDLFFTLVNLARFLGSNPEDALRTTTDKFMRRFRFIEERLRNLNKSFEGLSLAELDVYWDEAKEAGL